MSLQVNGIWVGGLWAPDVWVLGVWFEGDSQPQQDDVGGSLHKPNLSHLIKWIKKENPDKSITSKELVEQIKKANLAKEQKEILLEAIYSEDEAFIYIIMALNE